MARVALTTGRISAFKCPNDKRQSFLWDTSVLGLALRATPKGKPSYIFQGRFNNQTVRLTIGSPDNWKIDAAREKARTFQREIDEGRDPRNLKRSALAEAKLQTDAALSLSETERLQSITVGEVWGHYLEERRPFWSELHLRDHRDKAAAGGKPSKRRGAKGTLTVGGPLAPLMAIPLKALDHATIEDWAAREGKSRPSSTRLSLRLLTVFLNWCRDHSTFASVCSGRNPAQSKRVRELVGKPQVKQDVLLREQLADWFVAVRKIQNPVVSAYLQVLLLTGARPGEIIRMRWEDINFRWKGIAIKDKVDGNREIPLTPHVEKVVSSLPKRNEWVFSSVRPLKMNPANVKRRKIKAEKRGLRAFIGDMLSTSKTGRIVTPNAAHTRACRAAGLNHLTLHGMRRSFKSLTEWLEVPVGVVAQIQGHKPSATAEKHYTVRPLDLLRIHHERIESWMLEQAGIEPAQAEPQKKRNTIGSANS